MRLITYKIIMKFVGDILKKTREGKKISLPNVSKELKISKEILSNLENNYLPKDIDRVLPPPPPNQPKDPALEHIDAMGMKPFQAFPGQDHRAHVTAHLNFMASNFVRNNPSITAALEKNIMEHISLMAQEQVQLEFPQEMQMLPQMQQMAVQNPQMQQQQQFNNQQFGQQRRW
mgnify:CR=1 FL=1